MAQDEQSGYIAGVCNIGKDESGTRRNLGWVSLIITIVLLIVFVWAKINPLWRILTFFPATMSASGFLQAHFHFCSGFARKGVFNFGSPGHKHKVEDEASIQKDRHRGTQITLYAILIGLAVAIISTLSYFIK